jgi:hypothetical protein
MIQYDRSALKSLIVSPTAWTATSPLRWFDNFAIIAIRDEPNLGEAMHTYGVQGYLKPGEGHIKTAGAMYSSQALRRALSINKLTRYKHILNRDNIPNTEEFEVIANDHKIIDLYESKSLFRKVFSDEIKMPKYRLLAIADWVKGESYNTYTDILTTKLVVQHPDMSGSRGTFLVSSADAFDSAIETMLADSKHPLTELVVSERIATPLERSLQICILQDSILIGPPQAQLVRNPFLTYDAPDAIQFCGGRVSPELMSESQYKEASHFATVIAKKLQESGYRGIFGVDYLICDQVYVIEANLRRTGLSPLLASLQTNAPYMLLHILETAKQPYVLSGIDENVGEGSFITVYAQSAGSIDLVTGLYDVNLNRVGDGFDDANLLPKQQELFFVAMRVEANDAIKAGKSIAFVYSRTVLFDSQGELTTEGRQITLNIRDKFTES